MSVRKLYSPFVPSNAGSVLRLFGFHVELSSADLEDEVRLNHPRVVRDGAPMYCSVSGYDYDPRELWEIPEVVRLCQRIVDSGWLSLLRVNLDDRHPAFWGAWDVYATARGLFKRGVGGGHGMPSKRDIEDFRWCLLASNLKCSQLCGDSL